MIGNLPLWIVIAIWYTQRQTMPRVTISNYPIMLRQIEDMRLVLPVPRGRIETWLVTQILTWIDKEKESLFILAHLGVVMTGTVNLTERERERERNYD